MAKAAWATAATYNIEDRMQGLEEEAPNGKVRNDNTGNCRPEQRSACFQHASQGSRQHR